MQIEPDNKLDDDCLPKFTFDRINITKDSMHTTDRQDARPRKYFNEEHTTKILESAKGTEIPLASN